MTTITQAHSSMWRKIVASLGAIAALCGPSLASAGETISYFHDDLVGSPVMSTDANGLQAWKETYRPYGDQLIDSTAAQNNKIWFAGKPFDDSNGLSYMGARYYDPTLGRFMAVDPASFSFDNLHSFNRYAYANNNPYRYVDPDGEFAIPALEAVLIGGGVYIAGCQAAGSCQKFGEAVVNFVSSLDLRLLNPRYLGIAVASSYLSEGTKSADSPADSSASETPSDASGDEGGSDSDAGTRTPAPFLPDDPYSPEETSKRQSETRRQEGAASVDPDSPIPDRGPGRDIGGHPAREGTPHTTKERNVNPNEEHSRRTKRDPGGGPRR